MRLGNFGHALDRVNKIFIKTRRKNAGAGIGSEIVLALQIAREYGARAGHCAHGEHADGDGNDNEQGAAFVVPQVAQNFAPAGG